MAHSTIFYDSHALGIPNSGRKHEWKETVTNDKLSNCNNYNHNKNSLGTYKNKVLLKMPLLSTSNQQKSGGGKGEAMKKSFNQTVDNIKNAEILQVANGLDTFRGHESLKPYFENSYGFVIFDKIGKVSPACGCSWDWNVILIHTILIYTICTAMTIFQKQGGMGVGGAFGMGSVYVNNRDGTETLVGYSNMIQISVGLQLGGQVFSQIIYFQYEQDFERFTSGSFEFGVDAQVVALTASAKVSASTMGNQPPAYGIKPSGQSTIGGAELKYAKGLAVFTVQLMGLMYEATVQGQRFTYKPLETTLVNDQPMG